MIAPPRHAPHLGPREEPSGPPHWRFRIWQVEVFLLVLFLTVWLVTLGPLVAILAILVAKHVLVALLYMGMEHDARQRESKEQQEYRAAG